MVFSIKERESSSYGEVVHKGLVHKYVRRVLAVKLAMVYLGIMKRSLSLENNPMTVIWTFLRNAFSHDFSIHKNDVS